jgi:hypothetical protein
VCVRIVYGDGGGWCISELAQAGFAGHPQTARCTTIAPSREWLAVPRLAARALPLHPNFVIPRYECWCKRACVSPGARVASMAAQKLARQQHTVRHNACPPGVRAAAPGMAAAADCEVKCHLISPRVLLVELTRTTALARRSVVSPGWAPLRPISGTRDAGTRELGLVAKASVTVPWRALDRPCDALAISFGHALCSPLLAGCQLSTAIPQRQSLFARLGSSSL